MPAAKTLTVGSYAYLCTLLTADEGLEPLGRLLVLVGKPAAKALLSGDALAAVVDGVKNESQVDADFMAKLAKPIGEALDGLLTELSPADLKYFSGVFRPRTMVRGSNGMEVPLDGIFGEHFAGNYGAWREWVAFCLRENFASFLGGNGAIKRALAAAMAAKAEPAA